MPTKNSGSAFAAEVFGGTNPTVTISLDKTYELLMSVFSLPSAYIFWRLSNCDSQRCSKRTGKAKIRCFKYPHFISNYLQNCQRIGADSLCKKMVKIACGTQNTLFIDLEACIGLRASFENHNRGLVKTACLLIKYKKDSNQQCQRCTSTSELNTSLSANKASTPSVDSKTKEESESKNPTHCDKTVQCSKSTEFLKVSPELRFFSRSSLVINRMEPGKTQQQQQKQQQKQQQHRRFPETQGFDLTASPSLEYVANYRPEFNQSAGNGEPNLRSFSSTAIFGLQSGHSRARTVPAYCSDLYADKNYVFSQKSRGRKRERRIERIRELLQRTEKEMLRYSSFIEDDLSSLHSVEGADGKKRSVASCDVQAVKKILLDDYITEVKEIVRAESCQLEQEREARILEELKQRMDEDLITPPAEPAPSLRSNSWASCAPSCRSPTTYCSPSRSSYDTARECCCCCYCCHCLARCCDPAELEGGRPASLQAGSFLRGTGGSAPKRVHRIRASSADMSKNCPTCVDNIVRRRDWLKEDLWAMSDKAKSSHSLDSGVLTDYPRQAGDWTSSEGNSTRRADIREVRSCCSGVSCTDEVLCQRVESAVRKFTEELILCERRARDRSRSNRKRRDKWRTAPRDQSVFNYPRNSLCSSEDEFITGISTPSLVSLSDLEIPTSIQTET